MNDDLIQNALLRIADALERIAWQNDAEMAMARSVDLDKTYAQMNLVLEQLVAVTSHSIDSQRPTDARTPETPA